MSWRMDQTTANKVAAKKQIKCIFVCIVCVYLVALCASSYRPQGNLFRLPLSVRHSVRANAISKILLFFFRSFFGAAETHK